MIHTTISDHINGCHMLLHCIGTYRHIASIKRMQNAQTERSYTEVWFLLGITKIPLIIDDNPLHFAKYVYKINPAFSLN